MTDRKAFAKKVKVLCDTREQCNQHIIQYLHANGIATESRKLDFGDYSFEINGKCFERSCIVERKGSVDELFGNFVHDRERIQKEFDAAAKNAQHMELILEGVTSEEELKALIPKKREPKPRWPENTPKSVLDFCEKYWRGTTEMDSYRIHCWNDKAVWTSWPSGGYSTVGGWNPVSATFFMLSLCLCRVIANS